MERKKEKEVEKIIMGMKIKVNKKVQVQII